MCFSPIDAIQTCGSVHPSGKYKLIFPTNPKYNLYKLAEDACIQTLPCGYCEMCLYKRKLDWSIRAVNEARYYDKNSFITLTYKDSELPFTQKKDEKDTKYIEKRGGRHSDNTPATLFHRDFQLFMKRFRKMLDKKGIKIKYLMCGEYGEKFGRPHYHALIFGYQFDDLSLTQNNEGCEFNLYNSETLAKLWSHGIVKVGDVSAKSAAYVCGYTQKKMYKDEAVSYYDNMDRQAPYLACSKGIGKKFYDEFEAQLLAQDCLSHPETMKRCRIPRYYDKLTEKKYGELKIKEIKQKRLVNYIEKYYSSDMDTPRRRQEQREVFISSLKKYRRHYEERTDNTS